MTADAQRPTWAESDAAHPERAAEWDTLVRERDEARADLAGLREACIEKRGTIPPLWCVCRICGMGWDEGQPPRHVESFVCAIAATPATLAGQVRARVLREAADLVDTYARGEGPRAEAPHRGRMPLQTWLRVLADEAEAAQEGRISRQPSLHQESAGQVEARVLREAAEAIDTHHDWRDAANKLRVLADEAEKTK